MISLNKAVPEKSYFFVGVSAAVSYEKHLADLGFIKGRELRLLSKNAQDHVIVQVEASRIALTKELALAIMIEERLGENQLNYQTLASATVGSRQIVGGILGQGHVRRRLMDMGITRGVEVTLRKRAPLGDPLEINLRGYELTLRKAEAELIVVYEAEAAK